MNSKDFSYSFLIKQFPDEWKNWFDETLCFDELIETRIPDDKTRDSIKKIAKKIRDSKSPLTKSDLIYLKILIKNSHKIYHTSQWTSNYHTDIKLTTGATIDHIDLINKIIRSSSLDTSGLVGIFKVPTYNAHFPHFYSIIKNIHDEKSYPVYFPYWQSLYKFQVDKDICSYDDLTQYYKTFKVPTKVNKYKSFGTAMNVYHLKYLNWCLSSNLGYKKTESIIKLLRPWHYKNEPLLNQILTPMQKMKFINLDTWRQLNEKLFNAYIKCFKDLASGGIKNPAESMLNALNEYGIKGKVKSDNYGTFYIIGRELGIFYQDKNDKYILGELAKKYVENNISYSDYLKHYVLNTEFIIDDKIVHPFSEIVDVLKKGPATLEELATNCVNCIPFKEKSENATEKLHTFLKRAMDARLINITDKRYSLAKEIKLTEKSISKSSLSNDDFINSFVGTGKNKQENIVKNMINRPIPSQIFDGNTGITVLTDEDGSLLDISKYPLNQVLYGPPGTGKTYSTITKALNIIGLLEEKESYTKKEYEEAQKLFQNELGKRIEFVTMHQSFSYEDFVQGLKPIKSDDGKGITFDYKNGVFKAICERADESKLLLKRSTKTDETILIDKLFPSFLLSIDEQSVYDTLSAKKFEGKKISQKIALEYFNEKLGKKYCKAWRDKFDYVIGIKSPRVGYQADKFREGELEDFKEYYKTFEKLTPEKRKEKLITEWIDDKPETIIQENRLNNHVIILDEINRANISRVFGELIALIEKDKRDGKLTATLPSGHPFTVPSNLFIIGTMNTADKSIALVDIALRRRFQFMPLYPNCELLRSVLDENKFGQEEINTRVNLMNNLNKIIRAKKSVDFEIGHSYFMENESLINILNNQVLPLLYEYFMYDLRKVKEIIEKAQKDKEGNNIPKLGLTLNQVLWRDRGLLEVETIDNKGEQKEFEQNEADENTFDS